MDLVPRRFYLNDIFDNFLSTKEDTYMKCDIYETDGKYHIEMDIPGFEKNEIKVSSHNGYLTISAEKEAKEESDNKNYLRRERVYSKYQRTFYIGDLDEKNIDASFKDGILQLVIPKKQEDDSQNVIEIK